MTGSAVLLLSKRKAWKSRLGQVMPWAAMPMARADSGRVARLPLLPIQGALKVRSRELGQRKLGELLIPRHLLGLALDWCRNQSRVSLGATMSRAAETWWLLVSGSLAASSSGLRGARMSASASGGNTACGHWKVCLLKRMRIPTMKSLRRISGSP